MKEILIFIIILLVFGIGCASTEKKPLNLRPPVRIWHLDGHHLLYEYPNPDLAYKSITLDDYIIKEDC